MAMRGVPIQEAAYLAGVTVFDIQRWQNIGKAMFVRIGKGMNFSTYSTREVFAFALLADIRRQGFRAGGMFIDAAFTYARDCRPPVPGETWSPSSAVSVDAGACWAQVH